MYEVVTRLIVQRHMDGDWRQIPSSSLTNPLNDADWIRLHPLRITVLSHTNNKCGVAENPRDFRKLIEAVAGVVKVPYKVDKNADEQARVQAEAKSQAEHDQRLQDAAKGIVLKSSDFAALKPNPGSRDVVEIYQSRADREAQAEQLRRNAQ